jgi:nucleoside-diphosphate-sugar epimerase
MIGYATGKLSAEKALIDQDQVDYTIIRPHIVVGPEDNSGRLQFFCQRLLDGRPLILTNGGVQSLQFVYSRDLARSYRLALNSDRAVNQVYTLAGDKTCRLVEWVELLAEQLGVRTNLVSIPDDVVESAPFQYAENWVLKGTLTFDVSKAMRELDFRPTPIETWTDVCARWYTDALHAEDSPGYDDRDREVEFARRFQAVRTDLVD